MKEILAELKSMNQKIEPSRIEKSKGIESLLDKDELAPNELKQIHSILGEKDFQLFFQEYLFMSKEEFNSEKWKKKIKEKIN